MSKKSKGATADIGSGTVVAIILIIFSIVVTVIKGLIFWAILGAVIGVIVWIVIVIKNRMDSHQNNVKTLTMNEPTSILHTMPTDICFKNSEEEEVNLLFREYIEQQNRILQATEHVRFLTSKQNALIALKRHKEMEDMLPELSRATNELNAACKHRITFKTAATSSFMQTSSYKTPYSALIKGWPAATDSFADGFFKTPTTKIVFNSDKSDLIFTPQYAMIYHRHSKKLETVSYHQFDISCLISTEKLLGELRSDDEIEHTEYLYETKSGQPDRRYSVENNPSTVYVYRGMIRLTYNHQDYQILFQNKSLAKTAENVFRAYVKYLSKS